MSYSVDSNCGNCDLKKECTDFELIQGAVNTIHLIGYEKSHRGSGTITIDCQNFTCDPVTEEGPTEDCSEPTEEG